MSKSRDAFRTISEVSDWLDTPAHVLRFWESKFSQVKPVKRAGGRRYYRPQDMELLGGIKKLLHEDGMTIKGVQKLLREKGVKHVAGLGLSLEDALPEEAPVIEADSNTKAEAQSDEAAPAEERSDEAPAPETPAPETDAADTSAPESDLAVTNIVRLPRSEGPALSVDAVQSADATEEAEDVQADEAPMGPDLSAIARSIAENPSDASSRAQARIFHLLKTIEDPETQLGAHAAELAPILARLEALRGRISLR